MKTWKKLAPLVVALMMTLPALAMLSPAAARDIVPVAPTVEWQTQNTKTDMFLRFGGNNAPSCDDRALRPVPGPSLAAGSSGTVRQCSYSTLASPTQGGGDRVSFATPNPIPHGFNVSGNTALQYFHSGSIGSGSEGITLFIELRGGSDTLIATGSIRGDARDYETYLKFENDALGHRFFPGETLTVILFAATTALVDGGNILPGDLPRWSVRDDSTSGARLVFESVDAVKTATWTRDQDGATRALFNPLAADATFPQTIPRIVGVFAVQSAFGLDDAKSGNDPRFTIKRGSEPVRIGAANLSSLTGKYSDALSNEASGRAAWDFPDGHIDYRGYAAGPYTLEVSKTNRGGSAYAGAGVVHPFLISQQGVRLSAFPGESLSHDMRPGGSTTYLLRLNNTGLGADTYTLETLFVSGSPNTGWSTVISGPHVLANRVTVEAGAERFVTLTVTPPPGATAGASVIHQLIATSTVDPSASSTPVTLVSTVSHDVRHQVDLIVLEDHLKIEPALASTHGVYVWNRGTQAANYTFALQETPEAGWNVDLLLGQSRVKQMQVNNVRPGDIARVDIRAVAPIGAASNYVVNLVASSADIAELSAEKLLTFVPDAPAGVRLQILDRIGNVPHRVEITGTYDYGPFASSADNNACNGNNRLNPDCVDDGINGTWYRVWVTNTGKVSDTFRLTQDAARWASVSGGCTDSVFLPRNVQSDPNDDYQFYFRDAEGQAEHRDFVSLAPGETGELYLWRPVDRLENLCRENGVDFYSFAIMAKGELTGAEARSAHVITAEQRLERSSAVLVEPVARLGCYNITRPMVDLGAITQGRAVGAVEVGENITYRVRVTNGASWAEYVNSDGFRISPNLTVTLEGVATHAGWNASIRPVKADMSLEANPYDHKLTLSPVHDMGREGWIDHEIEVLVRAPGVGNTSAIAGERDDFIVRATMENAPGAVSSSLQIRTVITKFADVRLEAEQTEILAHAGKPGAFLVYIQNDGSFEAPVTLRASMNTNTTVDAGDWLVEPAEHSFTIATFKNRTVAILATPPAGASGGTTGEVTVTLEFSRNPLNPSERTNVTLPLFVRVEPPGSLVLESTKRDAATAPGGFANFTMTLRNTADLPVEFRVSSTPLPNWPTQQATPASGILEGGASRTITYVLRAPFDVEDTARFASIVRVEEASNEANFDAVAVSVDIIGGVPIPSLSAPRLQAPIERGNLQTFEVNVLNVGSAAGRLPLSIAPIEQGFTAYITNAEGDNITSLQLNPNELERVIIVVQAPRVVPENTLIPISLVASSPDFTQTARVTLRVLVQDYGVSVTGVPSRVDAFPGAATEVMLRLKNTGNANDTLNISAHMVDMPEWAVTLSDDEVHLAPNEEAEVRAIIRMSGETLPAPRSYDFKFFAGTVGGQGVDVFRNDSTTVTLTVLNYRALDVDGDQRLEVAVDANKRTSDGFEEFREVFNDGLRSVVVATAYLDGKARFLLDVPRDGSYDGVANVWFDPENVYRYDIQHAVDLNGDATPDYLLDTTRDRKIDLAYDTVSQRFWPVTEVKVFNDARIQYLVDTTGDGRPDRFFDPASSTVTKTQRVTDQGDHLLGIDTNDDGKANKYYDTATGTMSDAKVTDLSDFARENWYFFLAFVLLAAVSIGLLVRRARG